MTTRAGTPELFGPDDYGGGRGQDGLEALEEELR